MIQKDIGMSGRPTNGYRCVPVGGRQSPEALRERA